MSTRKSVSIVELEGIAAIVWGGCDGSKSLSQITELFSCAYPESQAVDTDIRTLIDSLVARELLILELGSLSTNVAELLNATALDTAKRKDADGASIEDNSTIPFDGSLTTKPYRLFTESCITGISQLLPEIEFPCEVAGSAIYLRDAHMGWHSNHSRSDGRVYCSWAETDNKCFFKYENPLTGEIVTEWEKQGWNIKSFTIPPRHARFWHCIGAECLRLSIGFRYNLPGEIG